MIALYSVSNCYDAEILSDAAWKALGGNGEQRVMDRKPTG